MRDPNRIDPFLQELGTIWKEECPDWRFGQFICNVFGEIPYDTFYIEDKNMISEIKKYFKRGDSDDSKRI